MSLRNHVVAVRALAAGVLIWIAVQIGQGLWLGEWRYALSGVVGGLLWLTLVVVLPLRSSIALACPSCGYSYAPVFCLKWPAPTAGSRYPQMSVPVGA